MQQPPPPWAAEAAARGDAPIKAEFLRTSGARIHVPSVAAPSGGGQEAPKKSKNQQKRVSGVQE